jgi:hypothetical protein
MLAIADSVDELEGYESTIEELQQIKEPEYNPDSVGFGSGDKEPNNLKFIKAMIEPHIMEKLIELRESFEFENDEAIAWGKVIGNLVEPSF